MCSWDLPLLYERQHRWIMHWCFFLSAGLLSFKDALFQYTECSRQQTFKASNLCVWLMYPWKVWSLACGEKSFFQCSSSSEMCSGKISLNAVYMYVCVSPCNVVGSQEWDILRTAVTCLIQLWYADLTRDFLWQALGLDLAFPWAKCIYVQSWANHVPHGASPEWDQSRPLLQAGCGDISTTPSPLQTSLHCICETHICAADQTETCSQKSLCSALSTFDLKFSFSPCLYSPLYFSVSSCSFQVVQWRVAHRAASQ